ncbi:MAG: hypothetical protein A2287_02845 [Candidatus Melainabacteria bacterium RIFOXYA12_FULL_32_12]|nr:MAG: hypothetical protein A2255_08290 [Candidatus Melainabacteria bacterium RIFOXYA2_FULL_32_9]OGI29321.1 MAG: hypothetical protein A2287_02845 [Candidatus Melainabacteria bacterium RIFOXYA12_FULL_32_12]
MLGQVSNLNNYYNAGYIPNTLIPASNANYNFPAQDYQSPEYFSTGSQYMRNYAYPQLARTTPHTTYAYPQIQAPQYSMDIPWITDPAIKESINKLREVRYLPGDVEHMKKLGVNILYNSGEEAMQTILKRGLRIEFGPVSSPKAHAQLNNDNNMVIINEKYRGTKDPAVILAISEAIFHELGHAKDNDGLSSIQEEINCLALNTLANRYHQYVYPQIFSSTNNADILNNGVSLYTRLFFDPDPKKEALANRIAEKYGDLPLESPNHSVPLAAQVSQKTKVLNNVK